MEKLAQYLSDSGKTQRALADEVGVDKSVMSRFRSGKAKPGREVAVTIERVTRGAVPVSAWSNHGKAIKSRRSAQTQEARRA